MRFHFTKHAKEKIIRVRQSGFLATQSSIKETVLKPVKVEDRLDGTHIAMTLLNGIIMYYGLYIELTVI